MTGTLTIHHEPIREANEVIIEAVAMKMGFRLEAKTITSVGLKNACLPDMETEQEIDKWITDFENWLELTLESDGWGDIVRRVELSQLSERVYVPRLHKQTV